MPDDDQGVGGVDSDLLERVGARLDASSRFSTTSYRPEEAPNAVVAEYDIGYFPAAIQRASLRIRWFESDDFNIHYSEQYHDGSSWECRWDRHPNDHNSREHFHPPPSATTPGTDVSYATDWRDVMADILEDIDRRIAAFWA